MKKIRFIGKEPTVLTYFSNTRFYPGVEVECDDTVADLFVEEKLFEHVNDTHQPLRARAGTGPPLSYQEHADAFFEQQRAELEAKRAERDAAQE